MHGENEHKCRFATPSFSRKLRFWEELTSRNFASPLYPFYLPSLVHPLLKLSFGRPCHRLTRIGWFPFRDCIVIQASHYIGQTEKDRSFFHTSFSCYCLLGKDLWMPGFIFFMLRSRAGLVCLDNEFRLSIHDDQIKKSSICHSFTFSLSSVACLLLALKCTTYIGYLCAS